MLTFMMWSNEQSLELIGLYKEKPVIWDPSNANYFQQTIKNQAWRDISQFLDRDVDDCKQKMISLLASQRRERGKVRRSINDGGEIYISSWFAYEALAFLGNRSNPRKRRFREPSRSSKSTCKATNATLHYEQYEQQITQVDITEPTYSDIGQDTEAPITPKLSPNFEENDIDCPIDTSYLAMDDEIKQPQKTTDYNEDGRNEFDVFCESLAIQLRKMPLERALICQEKLQSVMTQERLFQLTQ